MIGQTKLYYSHQLTVANVSSNFLKKSGWLVDAKTFFFRTSLSGCNKMSAVSKVDLIDLSEASRKIGVLEEWMERQELLQVRQAGAHTQNAFIT